MIDRTTQRNVPHSKETRFSTHDSGWTDRSQTPSSLLYFLRPRPWHHQGPDTDKGRVKTTEVDWDEASLVPSPPASCDEDVARNRGSH